MKWSTFKNANMRAIFKLTEEPCYYCGAIDPSCNTVDHKIPQSLGGTHDWDNLVSCCKACNSRKKDRTELQFSRSIIDRVTGKIYAAAEELKRSEQYLSDHTNYTHVQDLLAIAWNLADVIEPYFPGRREDVEE